MLVVDRELNDTTDTLRCLDAATGRELWAFRDPSLAALDYGNSSRATPLIAGERVYFFGAMGRLSCVSLATGTWIWQKDLRAEFAVTEMLKWGHCGSPLIASEKLIVSLCGPLALIIALQPENGRVLWKAPGQQPGYGSPNAVKLQEKWQIVAHDASTLGGWDLATGKRLWTVKPPRGGDFNVPTPLIHEGRLIVATENNGTRLFGFGGLGIIEPQPIATCRDLNPDTHTPVIAGQRLFGVAQDLLCLDLNNNLRVIWRGEDSAFFRHTNLIASPERLLASSDAGELLLIDARANEFRLLGRQKVFADEAGLLSHPALVGTRLYLRSSNEIVCVDLNDAK